MQTVKTWGITDKRREIPIKNEFERQTYSNFNFVVTRQYLLKSHTNFTITLRRTLQIENISHDAINPYLRY